MTTACGDGTIVQNKRLRRPESLVIDSSKVESGSFAERVRQFTMMVLEFAETCRNHQAKRTRSGC
jgi:hypothetical protein